jgi:hypothetical protein
MKNPTDQPDQQAEPDDDQSDQLVRRDVGGWISGPCLDAAALGPQADGPAEPGWAGPASGSKQSAQ